MDTKELIELLMKVERGIEQGEDYLLSTDRRVYYRVSSEIVVEMIKKLEGLMRLKEI